MSVLIIGDLILDVNYLGNIERIANEAPIPIFKIDKTLYNLGGAGNVAVNLKNLEINIKLISIVGNDTNGNILLELLKSKKIDTNTILISDKKNTTTKNRIYSNNRLYSRFDIKDNNNINDDYIYQIKNKINYLIDDINIVIISDYSGGLLTYDLTRYIIDTCNNRNIPTFVDPKDKNYEKYKECTMIKPNKIYAEIILNNKISSNKNILTKQILEIIKKINCKYCLLTLDKDGLVFYHKKFLYHPANKKDIIDVIGAGDSVLAGFTFYYLKTNDLNLSSKFANYCGQISVDYLGTYILSNIDVLNYKRMNTKLIKDEEISFFIETLNKNKKKIVFTNGCFDVLHYGHLIYLNEAKELGDVLIIGLNSDDSIRILKGEKRPINKLEYRIKQLEMLSIVDFIIVFNEKTPLNLIKMIKPYFLVKGGDYKIEDMIGKEYSSNTKILSFINDVSTTKIIKKLEINPIMDYNHLCT